MNLVKSFSLPNTNFLSFSLQNIKQNSETLMGSINQLVSQLSQKSNQHLVQDF